MAVAARVSQASSPTDSVYLLDSLYEDQQELQFSTRRYASLGEVIDIEVESMLLGTAAYIDLSLEVSIEDSLFHFYLHNIEFWDTVDVEVSQNYTEQLIKLAAAVDSGDAVARLDNLELELGVLSVNPAFFKEFIYSGESLTEYRLYTNSSKQSELLAVQFTYTGEDLTRKTLYRAQDNKSLIVDFNYSGGNLISQTRTVV